MDGPEPDAHRAAATQVFVEDLEQPGPDDADLHHLARVLRLRPGERVCAADGAGGWRMCEFTGAGDPARALEPVGDVVVVDRAEPALTVGFTPVKGERAEWVVQKLTELGIDRIAVLETDRSVVRWRGPRADKHLERLDRVAREACQQCRRLWLPEVVPMALAELMGTGAVLADPGGRALGRTDHAVLIGPEGGWTDDEREDFERVDLGGHVLRAETAALAAAVLMDAARRS